MTIHATPVRAPEGLIGRFVSIGYEECTRRLQWESVGRVAVAEAGAAPSVYPVNYAWHDGAILFRTTPRRAQVLAAHPVSFEVDRLDDHRGTGWSILVRGWVTVLRDSPLGVQPVTWAPDERVVTVSLAPAELTGREIFVGRSNSEP